MHLYDLQMVLDRLATSYSNISPQILRSAVEYTKHQAPAMPIHADDESGGKNYLYARGQGYIEGYCRIFDEFYNHDVVEIESSFDITRKIMDDIIREFGESAPTSFLDACNNFIDTVSIQVESLSEEERHELLLYLAIGFMEGAIDADDDIKTNKHIKVMSVPFTTRDAEILYEIAGREMKLRISDEDMAKDIRESACLDIQNMITHVLLPKSGNKAFEANNMVTCVVMYLTGYMKGLLGDDEEKEETLYIEGLCELSDQAKEKLRLSETLLSLWTRYNGYSHIVYDQAIQAMRDKVLVDKVFFQEDTFRDGEINMLVLLGMGYADGCWTFVEDDDYEEKVISSIEMSNDIDLIFWTMDD